MSAIPETFDYGDRVQAGPLPQLIARSVVLVFLVAIVGTGIADVFFPASVAEAKGHEALEQLELRNTARLQDGSLARLFEDDLQRHSRIKALVDPSYAFFNFAYLGEVPENMVSGKEHWLFLKSRIELSEQSSDVIARTIANSVIAASRRLAGNGTELCVMPIPRKAYVAGEFLPRGAKPRSEIDDLLLDQLAERGAQVVDLREVFADYEPIEIYHKLDSHWTPHAGRLAAIELAQFYGLMQPPHKRIGDLAITKQPPPSLMGVEMLASLGIKPQEFNLESLDLRPFGASSFSITDPVLGAWFTRPIPNVPSAFAGSSFSCNQRLAWALGHFAGQPVYDQAIQGQPYMTGLANVVTAYRDDSNAVPLERVYWEFPISTACINFAPIGPRFTKQLARFFGTASPRASTALVPPSSSAINYKPGELLPLSTTKYQALVTVAGGHVAHTGDGAVALSVAGEVIGEPMHLTFKCGETAYVHILEPGHFEMSLPVITSQPSTSRIVLSRTGVVESQIRIDYASIVHQAANPAMQALSIQMNAALHELRPKQPLHLGRRSALIIHTKGADAAPHKSAFVRLKVHTADGRPALDFHFSQLTPGGVIAVDLGARHTSDLSHVELSTLSGALAIESAYITGAE